MVQRYKEKNKRVLYLLLTQNRTLINNVLIFIIAQIEANILRSLRTVQAFLLVFAINLKNETTALTVF